MRSLTYYIATTIDGFIASPEGGFDGFLMEGDHMAAIAKDFPDTLPTHLHEMTGVKPNGDRFDTVLMGWNTYAVGLKEGVDSPYAHLRQYVVTNQERTTPGDVHLIKGDPVPVVQALKAEPDGSGIWLCGGGSLAATLFDEIDELALKVNPVLFGAGIPLFGNAGFRVDRFERMAVTPFESGVTLMTYRRA